MKWKEDVAQNTCFTVGVTVGVWSTMLPNGKGYDLILYMSFVMGKRTGMKSVTRFRKIMKKRTL
jgi:hypothetical protein